EQRKRQNARSRRMTANEPRSGGPEAAYAPRAGRKRRASRNVAKAIPATPAKRTSQPPSAIRSPPIGGPTVTPRVAATRAAAEPARGGPARHPGVRGARDGGVAGLVARGRHEIRHHRLVGRASRRAEDAGERGHREPAEDVAAPDREQHEPEGHLTGPADDD